MLTGNGEVRQHWRPIYDAIEKMGIGRLSDMQQDIDWLLKENGVTYNVYDDPEGLNRPWRLDPLPFLCPAPEWEKLQQALLQRTHLLNLIYRDIYGEQRLIREKILPPEIIFTHPGYLRPVVGTERPHNRDIHICSADISRGSDGKFWLIADRTQAPSGMGYVLENRLVMRSVSDRYFGRLTRRRLYPFYTAFKKRIEALNPRGVSNPLSVLLTPGPYNETYFEQAYLSAYLGMVLVQGGDLLVRNGRLWIKTLEGLRQVDTMLRRVDDLYCDPLELLPSSRLGVPALTEAIRHDRVALLNPLGTGVLESAGLMPFMQSICSYFLDEELQLPQVASWWCGQEKERSYVLEHLDQMIIRRTDRREHPAIIHGGKLSSGELETLKAEIETYPWRFVGQEDIGFATVPSFTGKGLEPRHFVLRSYAQSQEDGYTMLPGGLVRCAEDAHPYQISGQRGGVSKDLWIPDQVSELREPPDFCKISVTPYFHEILTSLKAEHFYWMGRYLARTIETIRLIRATLKAAINLSPQAKEEMESAREYIFSALTHMTMTYPGFVGPHEMPVDPVAEIESILFDAGRTGSLASTLQMLSRSNLHLRYILPLEAWKLFAGMMEQWQKKEKKEIHGVRMMSDVLDTLLVSLLAYKALIEETLIREEGLRLYRIGKRIETSLLLISRSRSMLVPRLDTQAEYYLLEALLSSGEVVNAYRSSYHSSYEVRHVMELLLFDQRFPRSLHNLLSKILKDLYKLPRPTKQNQLCPYEKPFFSAFAKLKLADIGLLESVDESSGVRRELDTLLAELYDMLTQGSDLLTQTYFSHTQT